MTDRPTISLFVKLKYWDIYYLNVVLMTILFRKLLYTWGTIAVVWLGLEISLVVRPAHGQDWAVMMHQSNSLWWVFALPLVFVFVLPLMSARRIMSQPRIKEGVHYRFSASGLHIETSVSTSDLLWKAIQRVRETRSMFMVFTNPNIAFAIPKWCFENAQDVASLRELLRAEVKTAKLLSD
jgi:YcxB-like protein